MRVAVSAGAVLIVAGGALYLFLHRAEPAPAAAPAQESSVPRTEPPPLASTGYAAPLREELAPSAHTTAASPPQPEGSWRSDAGRINAIARTFQAGFDGWVSFSVEDAERKKIGDRAIADAIWKSGGTTPALQVQAGDFAGLRQDQLVQVSYLLQSAGYLGKLHGNVMPADLQPEAERKLNEALATRPLACPPDLVLDSLGFGHLARDPAKAAELRKARVELMTRMAPSLATLDYLQRFTLKSAALNGVDRAEFDPKNNGDVALIAPLVHEVQAAVDALHREFLDQCRALAR